jgi:outer membrane protein assembly factor BamB
MAVGGFHSATSMKLPLFILPVVFTVTSAVGAAFDWPQWRGPNRDDISKETGLLKQWPADGPKKLWSFTNAGNGYSGFSVAGGKLFTMGTRDGSEVLICLDATNGKELWVAKLGNILKNDWGDGPRGTPTVDGDKVYTLGGDGTLVAAQVKDGKELWRRTMKELGGTTPQWGYTESVLVDGNQIVCTPGGPQGAIAALDKASGKTLWQSKDFTDGAQYASIIPATIDNKKQYVQLTMKNFVGIDAKDGSVLWKHDFPGSTAVIPTPIVKGNRVYVSAGYGAGSIQLEIGANCAVTVTYENKVMKNHHGGVILVGDHLYGHSDGAGWVCQDWKTGEQVWAEKNKFRKGAIAYADGQLYCLQEDDGSVALIDASPTGWNEKSRFKLDPQTTIRSSRGHIWTHPVISNGRLYLRDQDLIHAYALK